MNVGQNINGYIIVGVDNKGFSTKGGALSKWTFVEKNGVSYFLKEFLSPVYPVPDYPGNDELKAKKKTECETFFAEHLALKERVDKFVVASSNLIHTIEFFRVGTKFYKVTKKVNSASISVPEIANLPLEKRLFLIKTLSESLLILHRADIVHGDLKPENILITKLPNGYYESHLIDYDNSYLSGKPPTADKLVGDLPYYSPELESYVLGLPSIKASMLSQKSDIFALGLLFCQYLTGYFPNGISNGNYASSVVNSGNIIQIDTSPVYKLPNDLVQLVNRMLSKDITMRPNIDEVLNTLNQIPEKNRIQTGRLIINFGNKKQNP